MTKKGALGLHMTNVTGLGSSTLMQSLLPQIEALAATRFNAVLLYLPPIGSALATYDPSEVYSVTVPTRRYLPNAVSRLLECTIFGWRYRGNKTLIVWGDLPLAFVHDQFLFVHTAHVTRSSNAQNWRDKFKYAVSRAVFRLNQRFVRHVIVQTDVMAERLLSTYPSLSGRISVISQPAPEWLLANMKRGQRTKRVREGAPTLIFPSAEYPHKNHRLLYRCAPLLAEGEVDQIIVTIDRPNSGEALLDVGNHLRFAGRLKPSDVVAHYREIDALLFPSVEESFGLPLVEAMYIGLPILCADMPYARTLCGDGAIYFEPHDPGSLRKAIVELGVRLNAGWWPDWNEQLTKLPISWNDVADRILDIAQCGSTRESKTA